MGIEYLITYPADHSVPAQDVLRHLGCHWNNEAGNGYFSAIDNLPEHAMPDASIAIEADGVYFCDHGGKGRDYLGRVIAAMVSQYEQVTVLEYE